MPWRLLQFGFLALLAGLAWPAACEGASAPIWSLSISAGIGPLAAANDTHHEDVAQDERPTIHLLSAERSTTPRPELRQSALKSWLPSHQSTSGSLSASWPLVSFSLHPKPQPRLHVLLCTWLN